MVANGIVTQSDNSKQDRLSTILAQLFEELDEHIIEDDLSSIARQTLAALHCR